MEEFMTVPLQDGETSLPIARISVPYVAFANATVADYAVVHLDDSSAYDVVEMKVLDSAKGIPLPF